MNIILKDVPYIRWTCDICGELQEKEGVTPQIEDVDICRNCLEAGPEGAIERARLYASRLQKAADWLENEVPKVLRDVSPWLTGADYDAFYQEREKAMMSYEMTVNEEVFDKTFGDEETTRLELVRGVIVSDGGAEHNCLCPSCRQELERVWDFLEKEYRGLIPEDRGYPTEEMMAMARVLTNSD